MNASTISIVVGIAITIGPEALARAEPETEMLARLRAQFEELKADMYAAEIRFDERYGEELRTLEARAKAEPNLELVLAVREEAATFRARGSGAVDPSSHPELARLQKIYRDQSSKLEDERNGRLVTLFEGYSGRLEALQTELTRENKIDAALAVRKELNAVEEALGGLAPEAAEPDAPEGAAPAVVTGRRIRIELPGERRTLHLAEVEIFSGDENVALGGKAEQSSLGHGGLAEFAIDGKTEGDFAVATGSHTQFETSDPWIEVKLTRDVEISRLVVWNRTDGSLQSRLNGMEITIFDKRKKPVWSRAYPEAPQTKLVVDFGDPADRE